MASKRDIKRDTSGGWDVLREGDRRAAVHVGTGAGACLELAMSYGARAGAKFASSMTPARSCVPAAFERTRRAAASVAEQPASRPAPPAPLPAPRSSRAQRGFASDSTLAACSGAAPIRIRLTGTSSTLPESVRGTSRDLAHLVGHVARRAVLADAPLDLAPPARRRASRRRAAPRTGSSTVRSRRRAAGHVDDERVEHLRHGAAPRGRSRSCPCARPGG